MAEDEDMSQDLQNEFDEDQSVSEAEEEVITQHASKNAKGGKKGRGKGRGTNAKEKKNAAKAGGRPTKVANGYKYCKGCDKSHVVADFPDGSAQCWQNKRALQNFRNACIQQDHMHYYDRMMDDERFMRRTLAK